MFSLSGKILKKEVCYEKNSAFGRVVYDCGFSFVW